MGFHIFTTVPLNSPYTFHRRIGVFTLSAAATAGAREPDQWPSLCAISQFFRKLRAVSFARAVVLCFPKLQDAAYPLRKTAKYSPFVQVAMPQNKR